MEWILIIAGILVAWYFLRSPRTEDGSDEGTDNITIHASFVNGRSSYESVDSGPVTETAPGKYVINPESPLPLTLSNCTEDTAKEVKRLLDGEFQYERNMGEITFLFASENLQCVELESFIDSARIDANQFIEILKRDSNEWQDASEKDKLYMIREYEKAALEKAIVKPADLRAFDILLFARPSDVTVDDALLDVFSGNKEIYQFYVSHLGSSKPKQVSADDYSREKWESLVELGMAKRGKDIPVKAILETLRVKDLNEYFGERSDKKLTRKLQAIEFAAAQPDVIEMLSKNISFRELFQVTEPPSIDITQLKNCFEYAAAQAEVVRDTFVSGCRTLRTLQYSKESKFEGWEIEAEDCCDGCLKSHGRKTKRRPKSLPPFHIGCTCSIDEAFD